MGPTEMITFLKILSSTPKQIDEIKKEREEAFVCVQKKLCKSIWRPDIQDWVVIPYTENELKEIKQREQLKKSE